MGCPSSLKFSDMDMILTSQSLDFEDRGVIANELQK